jgi:hypothetical protein
MRRIIAIGSAVALTLLLATAGAQAAEAEARVLELGKFYKTAETGLNLTQSSYSDNWRGGDRGSLIWTWNFNGSLESQVNPKTNWLTQLKLAFGQTHQQVGQPGARNWDKLRSPRTWSTGEHPALTLGGYVDPLSGPWRASSDASDPYGRSLFLNPLQFKESADSRASSSARRAQPAQLPGFYRAPEPAASLPTASARDG